MKSDTAALSDTRYSASAIEDKWYQHWLEKNYFHSEPDDREAYTIVIPPPNVTGKLHMGHMLNNTIQDILIRKARLEGKNACWVPGTDHASIATEAKVVKMLREKGIKKSDLSRDEFLQHAWAWKEEYGGIILKQLQRLGASCDWERTRFTMEEKLSDAVIQVFVDLFQKGKIYRGLRMTNWDPEAQTVLSNEEVIHQEENSQLYHVRYRIEGSEDEYITIATTRPETILGDTAVAVHPEDERYAHLRGKKAIVPVVERAVPIIFDDYVTTDFGTGALKVTPAHDVNDYEIGQRHQLETIDVLNADGTMSEQAQHYIGQDRFKVRKQIAKDLEASGHLVKKENYRNSVGRSERTNAVIESRLTLQWFVDMKSFSKTALDAVKEGEVTFYPEHSFNKYRNWLIEENVRDWCISRQLWWGQRIPAWYYGTEHVFVARTAEEALQQARMKTGKDDLQLSDLAQDEDVLDTWFSSWLWPISVFDGFERKDELAYYYPTNVLVTGWDIIYLWVARMIMAGYEYAANLLGESTPEGKGLPPFHDVYFTGMVRDEKRRKMSKSLGNSPEALKLIDHYGADGVRFGMLSSAAAGNDIIFDAPIDPETKKVRNESKLCEQGMNFCNKMWNALRLIKGWEVSDATASDESGRVAELATTWFENRIREVTATIHEDFSTYRLSDSLMSLYKLIWGDFCSWYLEMIKPERGATIHRSTYEQTLQFYERLMTLLHPFMPFITEEIWHQLRDRKEGEDCIVSSYPQVATFDKNMVGNVTAAQELITKIRDLRNTNGLKQRDPIPLYVRKSKRSDELFAQQGLKEMVEKMAYLEGWEATDEDRSTGISFLAGTEKYFLEVELEVDTAAEIERLENELNHQRGFVKGIEKKLSNERFVNNAPAPVVDKERKKLSDGQARIKVLEENLARLRS